MSPYLSNVVNATQANINESNAEQQQQLQGNAISAGAWGGDRAGVAQAELARQQDLAGQQTIANLYNTGYGQAVLTAQQQQQQQSTNAQALYGIGTQQQQTNQNALTAAYQQYLLQQQYPFATTQYLSGIIGQQTPGAGGTSTQTTSGNVLGDVIGGVSTAAGLFGFKDGGVIPHRAMGGSNVMNMADAIRTLPPQVLAALHARMTSNPMLRQAAPMQVPARGFADGGMPYTADDAPGSDGIPLPSISSIVPSSAPIQAPPSLANTIPVPQAPANDASAPTAATGTLASLGNGEVSSYLDQQSRNPLLAFGLGTLAGSNNPGASAIGRGGLATLQGIETRRKADLDAALEREQLRGAGTENSLKDLQLSGYQARQRLLAAQNAGTSGAVPVTPQDHANAMIAEANAPAGNAPTTADIPAPVNQQVPPLFNAQSIMQQYQIAAATPGQEGLATQLLSMLHQGVPEGSYIGIDNALHQYGGYLSGVSAKADAEAAARTAETPHYAPTRDAFGNTLSFDTRTGQAVPVNGAGDGVAIQDWAAKAQALENGTGNPGAKNPNSTATGNGQFINSTWLTNIKAAHPDLAKTMTDPQLLALRSVPSVANEMTIYNAKQNATALTASGIPVNSSTLLLAHRFGLDGAKTILAAPDTATMGSILPANVITANPDIASTPVSVYKANIAAKMGTAPIDLSGASHPANEQDNPIISSWVANVTSGNATMAQVPAPLRNRVSMALQETPTSSYSPLAVRRLTMSADAIADPYKKLPQYSLTANGLPYLQRIDAALKTPGSVSDQDLLDSLTKLNTAGNAVTDAQVRVITDGKSFSDWLGVVGNKLQNGGVLSNNQRQQIREIANNIYANYRSGYQPVYDQAVSQLKAAGIPKQFWTIPDLNTLNGGQARAGTAPPLVIPQMPPHLPENSQYSPSRKMWRDPSGKLYDANGNPTSP